MIRLETVDVETDEGAAILRGVSLDLDQHRVALIGANGSGKTTLARLLNGLTLPTRGRVSVDGHDTRGARREVQRRVGFVFQEADHQLVYPTPAEDVALGLRARGVPAAEADDRARAALAALGLAAVADQAIHTLSGGEKQLVALAGTLVLDPAWVVLDEPTAALDLRNRRRVIDALAALEVRAVVVSHDLEHVAGFDRAVLLQEGVVATDGPPDEVIAAYVAAVGT